MFFFYVYTIYMTVLLFQIVFDNKQGTTWILVDLI